MLFYARPNTIEGFFVIHNLRKNIPMEEFDYQTLSGALEGYARPRDKISALIKKGIIIRVKKGLYVFGEESGKKPYSIEILANLIYGPSYISLDYALQHYGLIPERVEALTSVTIGRSRRFSTPVGLFTYRMIPLDAFRTGMDRLEIDGGRAFLIATAEKALADRLYVERGSGIRTQKTLVTYLEDNLRIDTDSLFALSAESLDNIARHYRSKKIALLSDLIRRMRSRIKKEKDHA
jgi:predicted transcriptional regulator of viral defense system